MNGAEQARDVRDRIHCVGYFGLGGGYAIGSADELPKDGQTIICSDCDQSGPCWELHKKRCQKLDPARVEAFEEMAKTQSGEQLVQAWIMMTGELDPYTLGMQHNAEDGITVGQGGQPADRGVATIHWPLPDQ